MELLIIYIYIYNIDFNSFDEKLFHLQTHNMNNTHQGAANLSLFR